MLREKHLRVDEFAKQTGYKIPTVRKKILRREIFTGRLGGSSLYRNLKLIVC